MHKSFNICPNACNYIIYTSYLNIFTWKTNMKGHITKTSVQRNADRTKKNISMNSNNYVYIIGYI